MHPTSPTSNGAGGGARGRRDEHAIDDDAKENIWWPALSAGNLTVVSTMIAKGADCNAKDPVFGWTPLIAACNSGKLALVKLISENHGKSKDVCNDGNSALALAARNGFEDIVGFMLSKKADPNLQNRNGWSALIWAAMNGHDKVVEVLCRAGAEFNLYDEDGMSALMWAARHGHTAAVEQLLKKGIDLGITDKYGFTVSDHAREYQELRVILGTTNDLQNQMMNAAKQNDMEGVAYAIEQGINVNMHDGDGWSPIMWAAMHGSVDLVQLLLRNGANPDFVDANGVSVQDLAPEHTEVREVLNCTYDANKNLLKSAKADDWEGVERALQCGAWVNMQDPGYSPEESMRSALMWASRHGAVHSILELAAAKADLELRDDFGWTALLYAISVGHVGAVSTLHHLKASFKVKSFEGDRPLHMAVRADDSEMVQVLIAAGLSLEDLDGDKLTPVLVASSLGCSYSLQALLALGSSATSKNQYNQSGFMLATMQGHQKCLEVFIEKPPPLPRDQMDQACGEASGRSSPSSKKRDHGDDEDSKKPKAPASKKAPAPPTGKGAEGPLGVVKAARTKQEALKAKPVAPMKASAALAEVDSTKSSALSYAVKHRYLEIVRWMLEIKAPVDQADEKGNTPLIIAVMNGDDKIALDLLNANANFLHRNAEDKKALDVAPTEKLREMLKKRDIGKLLAEEYDTVKKKSKGKGKAKAKDKKKKEEEEDEGEEEPEEIEPEKDEELHKIRFEQLPTKLTEDMLEDFLRSLLKHLGTAEPQTLEVVVDPITQGPRGHAYAGFDEARSKAIALKGDGKPYRGLSVRIFPEEKPAWLKAIEEKEKEQKKVAEEEKKRETTPKTPPK